MTPRELNALIRQSLQAQRRQCLADAAALALFVAVVIAGLYYGPLIDLLLAGGR